MFIGGPVATAYSTLIISKEMAKSMPMLYNMASSLVEKNGQLLVCSLKEEQRIKEFGK